MSGATVKYSHQGTHQLYATTSSGGDHPYIIVDLPFDRSTANGACKVVKDDLQTALATHQEYPSISCGGLTAAMGWGEGVHYIEKVPPDSLCFDMRPETAFLLPELIPIGHDSWLDKAFPCYRTLGLERPVESVGRQGRRNLAIIFQDIPEFKKLTAELTQSLVQQGFVNIDRYCGKAFVDKAARYKYLGEVFFKHRAVAFIGHLRNPDGDRGGGWMMTEGEDLPLSEVAEFLGVRKNDNGQLVATVQKKSNPMPDLLFLACCSGATGDSGLFYPQVFTTAGIGYFIGTGMDLKFPSMKACTSHVFDLLRNFFLQWFPGGDDCVSHLYNSKKACDFPLVSALYQIYTSHVHHRSSKDLERSRSGLKLPPSERVQDPVVSSIRPGDHLGSYVVVGEAWNEAYSRFLMAKDQGLRVLLQVLTDECQEAPDLLPAMARAISKIQNVGLGQAHLVPTRAERMAWRRNGQALSEFYVVVYHSEAVDEIGLWRPLQRYLSDQPQRQTRSYFDTLITTGGQIAALLAELHERGLVHGNIDSDSILIRNVGAFVEVVLKDTWVREALPGRRTPERYAAPLEEEGPDRNAMVKSDCFALGVLLFESATGRLFDAERYATGPVIKTRRGQVLDGVVDLPSVRKTLERDAGPTVAEEVPDALERIIADCMKPAAGVRPTSASTADKLKFAAEVGGKYAHDVIAELEGYIRANRRLFRLYCDDIDEAEALLMAFSPAGNGSQAPYHLLIAEEDVGLRDPQQERRIFSWEADEKTIREIFEVQRQGAKARGEPPPVSVSADQLAVHNAAKIMNHFLHEAEKLLALGRMPILLIRGGVWWSELYGIERCFHNFHENPGRSPVVIVADQEIRLDVEIERLFMSLVVPPASASGLYDTVIAFRKVENIDVEEISEDMAVALSIRMFPCSTRQAQMALRLAALERGRLDERVIDILNEDRARLFSQLGTASYTPPDKLRPPDHVGIKQSHWQMIRRAIPRVPPRGDNPIRIGAQRVLITGSPGAGKTTLAEALAAWRGCPLIRIDAASCLRGEIGGSEAALRQTLGAAALMHFAVVLLDDVDRFFQPAETQVEQDTTPTSLAATMMRMSGILLHWWDHSVKHVPGMLAVMTATEAERLPMQWKRRHDLRFELASPTGPDEKETRLAVFRAVFRRHGLNELSGNAEFTEWLASETDRSPKRPPVLSAFARCDHHGQLASQRIDLSDAAAIDHWVCETILLHQQHGDPATPEFWRAAATED